MADCAPYSFRSSWECHRSARDHCPSQNRFEPHWLLLVLSQRRACNRAGRDRHHWSFDVSSCCHDPTQHTGQCCRHSVHTCRVLAIVGNTSIQSLLPANEQVHCLHLGAYGYLSHLHDMEPNLRSNHVSGGAMTATKIDDDILHLFQHGPQVILCGITARTKKMDRITDGTE